MLQILIVSGFFLSALLLYFNIRKQPGILYLGLFFLLLSTYSFLIHVMYQSEVVWHVGITFINGAIPAYLIGPFLYYFYIRSIIRDSGKLDISDLIHFLPVLIYLLAALSYIFSPWSLKEEFASQIIQDRRYFWIMSRDIVNWLIPNEVNFISRPGLILFYSILSLVKLMLFRNKTVNLPLIRKYNLNYNWLFSLLVFVILLTLSHTILTVISILNKDVNFYISLNIIQVVGAIGFLGIVLLPFFYPSVLYGLPHFSQRVQHNLNMDNTNGDTINLILEKEVPYTNNNPEFETGYLQFIEEATEKSMLHDMPYLFKSCNLNYFARMLNIPTHHLSYYFREVKKQTFNDYRNTWRIKHAKKLIAANMHKQLTMDAVGSQSGFTSKNAFFTAFKKFEKMTPGQYAEDISDT